MNRRIKWYQTARIILPVVYGTVLAAAVVGKSFIVMTALMASALLAGAYYCGWLCPFGAVQEWIGKLGRKLKLPLLKVPAKVEKWLRFARYILMGLTFTGLAAILFITSPYGTFMGALTFNIARITAGAWILFGLMLLSSLFIDRPFCRYMCTEGARYGLISLARIFSIKRNKHRCTGCGACDRKCPTQVKISNRKHVRNFQCINCFECIAACPEKNTLTYGLIFTKKKERINEVY